MLSEVWSKAKETLQGCTSPVVFDCWIEPLALLQHREDTVVLAVPDRRFLEYVASHHSERIRSALSLATGRSTALEFEVIDPGTALLAADGESAEAHSTARVDLDDARSSRGQRFGATTDPGQLPLFAAPRGASTSQPIAESRLAPSNGLVERLSFERLVTGRANELALGAARAVAESRDAIFNPLYLQGSVGNGKTHLLHAIGNLVAQRQPALRVRYAPASSFVDDTLASFQSKTGSLREAVRERYRNTDVLLVDDVQFLQGKERTQEEFFHTFNILHQSGKRIVLSADRPPAALEPFQERLRNRFVWGLVAEIGLPDEAMRLEILLRKAEERRLHLPTDVARLVAERVRGNVRDLEGVLHRLEAFHHIGKHRLDSDLARAVLGPLGATGGLADLDAILRATAEHYGLRVPDLKGSGRQRHITTARMVATYLARKHLHLSFPELGRAFGGRDHSTAHHACQRVQDWLGLDPQVAQAVAAIETQIAPLMR